MIPFAVVSGAIVGVILLFFSHIAPALGAGNFVRDLDQPYVFGKNITRREAHLLGACAHVLISTIFGGLFAYLVSFNIFPGFDFFSILGWGCILSLFVGGVVLPLEGHGLFGTKEDAWFPVDLFLTNILWSILFWWTMRLWQGVT